MASNKRVVIGSEVNDDRKIELDELGTKIAIPVALYNSNGNQMGGVLIPEDFDHMDITYVASGNGAGEIETVVYKTGGSGGTTVATLTLAYNASNEISSITKT